MAKRTAHRSTAGKKLYAVKDKKTGEVKEIQTYQRSLPLKSGKRK